MKMRIESNGLGGKLLSEVKKCVSFNETADFWYQPAVSTPQELGEFPYLKTHSELGFWGYVNNDCIMFEGRRGSFLKGTQFFRTGDLLGDEEVKYYLESSVEDPIVLFDEGKTRVFYPTEDRFCMPKSFLIAPLNFDGVCDAIELIARNMRKQSYFSDNPDEKYLISRTGAVEKLLVAEMSNLENLADCEMFYVDLMYYPPLNGIHIFWVDYEFGGLKKIKLPIDNNLLHLLD